MRPHLILSAALLALTLLGSGSAFAQHNEDHYTKGQLKAACDSAGGASSVEYNGSYQCTFTDGGYIECNKKHDCVGGYNAPGKLTFGGFGRPKIDGNTTDGGNTGGSGKFGGVRANITNAHQADPGGQVHVTTDPSGPPAGNGGHKSGIGKIFGLGNQG